jgi:hypothetical protein
LSVKYISISCKYIDIYDKTYTCLVDDSIKNDITNYISFDIIYYNSDPKIIKLNRDTRVTICYTPRILKLRKLNGFTCTQFNKLNNLVQSINCSYGFTFKDIYICYHNSGNINYNKIIQLTFKNITTTCYNIYSITHVYQIKALACLYTNI